MVYWGVELCMATKANGDKCLNGAYYKIDEKLFCGVHSSGKKKETRVKLPRNPNEKNIKIQQKELHAKNCDKIALDNKKNGRIGRVILYKMRMMKLCGFEDGFINIFPNFKHGNRNDGLGFPSLSPKSIGPIHHNQPGLPVALNLENFHQGNKVFPSEVDEKGEVMETFYNTQLKMYTDATPHRHKDASGGKNVPVYSLWKDTDGTIHKISYFTSRQFYCVYYERNVITNPDFLRLKEMIANGYQLRICGYYAYDPKDKSMEECYCDISRPFGHELVLYTMLTENEMNWPWKKYKTFEF